MIEPILDYRLTKHAAQAMARRQIGESIVAAILANPEKIEIVRTGRAVFQARVQVEDSQTPYLIRIFVDIDRNPPEIVTVYRTSKIQKYMGENI
ncbi:MAG: DUF4258 domain-containing protein [Acidobacteriota bacterium]|nr:MAG: DUF4258 domain-containing protein [Acidobacteriota bacterium]